MQDLLAGLLVTGETQFLRRRNQVDEGGVFSPLHNVAGGAPHRDCRVHVLSLGFIRVALHALGCIRSLSQGHGMLTGLRPCAQHGKTSKKTGKEIRGLGVPSAA
jgi:hypothetical protein